ncbi:MAG TPA: hypothetical protein VMH35_18660 [Streptosporangiaceae bacterium]|nr:hypothetical protein [Streptosporangiaceae bacterium]
MDEIELFGQLQPPPPPDVARMREAARARLTAATTAPPAHPARRPRSTVLPAAAAAVLVAAGTGYGLAAAQGGPGPRPSTATRGGLGALPGTAAGLTAVHGCPGKYITAGTLEQVSGTWLILQPANDQDHQDRTWRAQPVTVATSRSTVITRPVSGTVSDITDGSHVVVQGTWSGGRLAAAEVGIEAALPAPSSFGPPVSHHLRKLMSKGGLGPPAATGMVVDVHDGGFTVLTQGPFPGAPARVQVTTSNSTRVVTKASASLSQLDPGANVVAVGQIGSHGVLTASTVAEPPVLEIVLAGGPARLRPSGCSASAITTAAVLAGG